MEGGNASMYPLLQRDSEQGFFCLVVMAIVPKDGVNIAAKEHVTLRTSESQYSSRDLSRQNFCSLM